MDIWAGGTAMDTSGAKVENDSVTGTVVVTRLGILVAGTVSRSKTALSKNVHQSQYQ
jgi:hypothetical protein